MIIDQNLAQIQHVACWEEWGVCESNLSALGDAMSGEYVGDAWSPNFIEEYGELSLIEENVVFGLVADKGTEVFADDAVPIGAVLLVELFLDVFGHEVFCFQVVDRVLCLPS